MYDELNAIGLDAFTKKYDPYWDIPLNESLPQPVIDLPITDGTANSDPSGDGVFRLTDPAPTKTRPRRKKS